MPPPPELQPLAEVLFDLELFRPWLVFQRGGQHWALAFVMNTVRRDLRKGPEWSRRSLLAPEYWWEDDTEGRTVIMRMTPEGPKVLAAEAGSKSVPP